MKGLVIEHWSVPPIGATSDCHCIQCLVRDGL